MLATRGQRVPKTVEDRLGPDEDVIATLNGLAGSGLSVTGKHLFAWRAMGSVGPIPLASIDRILVDEGGGTKSLAVVVLFSLAIQPPLVLMRRANELATTLDFIAQVVTALGVVPEAEHMGGAYRYTFRAGIAS